MSSRAGLTSLENQHMNFGMQDDETPSLNLMDVKSTIDVGEVGVKPNILLLNDVCFHADETMEVNSYRIDFIRCG